MKYAVLIAMISLISCHNPTRVNILPRDVPKELSTISDTTEYVTSSEGYARIMGDKLYITLMPRNVPNDYQYQIFLDVDGDHTNGQGGYDYVCRGPDMDPYGLVIRNMDYDDNNPGGWGAVVGNFTSRVLRGRTSVYIDTSNISPTSQIRVHVQVYQYGAWDHSFVFYSQEPV